MTCFKFLSCSAGGGAGEIVKKMPIKIISIQVENKT
jgi:hypothetical protein